MSSAAESRARHPAQAAWKPDLGRLAARLADVLQAEGAMTFPAVAAAVLSARGACGDDPAAFARRVGISARWLRSLEAGLIPASGVPPRVRGLAPWTDWNGLA